jgi:mannosyltransferase
MVIALGFGLRLFHLDAQSFWYDEAFSAGAARGTPAQILSNDFRDVHPPLYYLILHLWLALGESDLTIRLLSAILGVAGIAAIYSLGKTLFDNTVGLIAATIAAVAPYKIFYSQEARMYTLLFVLIAMLLVSYIRMLHTGSRRWWLAYTISAVLGLYTHYLTGLVLVSLHLHSLTDLHRERRHWERVVKSDALIILALLPQSMILLGQAQRIAGNGWIPPPSLAQLLSAPYTFILSQFISEMLVPLAFAAVLFCFIITHLQIGRELAIRGRDRAGLILLLCAFWSPLLLTFIISQWQPVYLERGLIVAVPALYLLVSWGAVRTRERYVNLLLLFLVTLFAINALHNWYFDPDFGKPPFRTVTQHLQSKTEPGELVLHTSDGAFLVFLQYGTTHNNYLLEGDPTPHLPLETYRLFGGETIAKEELPTQRFWLVVALDNSVEFQRSLVDWFDEHHNLLQSYDFGGINLRYYNDTQAALQWGITTPDVGG